MTNIIKFPEKRIKELEAKNKKLRKRVAALTTELAQATIIYSHHRNTITEIAKIIVQHQDKMREENERFLRDQATKDE